MIWNYGKALLEAVLLAAPGPLSILRLSEILTTDERETRILLADLIDDYKEPGRGLMIRSVAGGYQLATKPEYSEYIERLLQGRGRGLSKAALETLAIIAYRQPVSRPEIEATRGVKVDKLVEALLERGLIKEMGRKEAPGRPILYGTTKQFLTHFGLNDLTELPPITSVIEEGRSLLEGLPAGS